jgi:hypothetical protein
MTSITVGLNLLNDSSTSQNLTIGAIQGLQAALNSKEDTADLVANYYTNVAINRKIRI